MNIPPFASPDDRIVAVLRRMTTAERIARAGKLHERERGRLRRRFKRERPDWSSEQIEQQIARAMLGEDLWNQMMRARQPKQGQSHI